MCEPGATWCVGDDDRGAHRARSSRRTPRHSSTGTRATQTDCSACPPRPLARRYRGLLAAGGRRLPRSGCPRWRRRWSCTRRCPRPLEEGANAARARLGPTGEQRSAVPPGRRSSAPAASFNAVRHRLWGERDERPSSHASVGGRRRRRADTRRATGRRTRGGGSLQQRGGGGALPLGANGRRAPLPRVREARRPLAGRAGAPPRRRRPQGFQSRVVPRFLPRARPPTVGVTVHSGRGPGQRRRHEGTRHHRRWPPWRSASRSPAPRPTAISRSSRRTRPTSSHGTSRRASRSRRPTDVVDRAVAIRQSSIVPQDSFDRAPIADRPVSSLPVASGAADLSAGCAASASSVHCSWPWQSAPPAPPWSLRSGAARCRAPLELLRAVGRVRARPGHVRVRARRPAISSGAAPRRTASARPSRRAA